MSAAITSLIAVFGTLLGSVATHVFQHRTAERSETLARDRQLREEQLAVFSAFARTVTDYRRGQNDRWFRGSEEPGGAAHKEARIESYRLWSAASQELFRMRMLVTDEEVLRAADEAFEVSDKIHHAADRQGVQEAGQQANDALQKFVGVAGRQIQRSFSGRELP